MCWLVRCSMLREILRIAPVVQKVNKAKDEKYHIRKSSLTLEGIDRSKKGPLKSKSLPFAQVLWRTNVHELDRWQDFELDSGRRDRRRRIPLELARERPKGAPGWTKTSFDCTISRSRCRRSWISRQLRQAESSVADKKPIAEALALQCRMQTNCTPTPLPLSSQIPDDAFRTLDWH